jgi:hypothetical protein
MGQEGHHAAEARRAPFRRDILQGRQKLRVVLAVIALWPRVARRVDPRLPLQVVDLDSRVVRQRGQPCVAGGVPGLQDRVLDEGQPGLLAFLDLPARLRHDLQADGSEQFGELADLSGVSGCQHDACHVLSGS